MSTTIERIMGAALSTVSSVSSSASSVTLIAQNIQRVGLILFNDSTANCYLKFGSTATTSDYTLKMEPASAWIMTGPVYMGRIDAIWDAANGAMKVTELVNE